MLLPGTFLGVWNLIAISSHRAANSVSPAWIQAHGHAQIFGWIGTFILGIGFYSIPKLSPYEIVRRYRRCGHAGRLWTSGVTLRWLASVYQWHWRALLPLSAMLELAAFLIFFLHRFRPSSAGRRQAETGRLGEGGHCGLAGADAHSADQLRRDVVSRFSRRHPRVPQSFDQRLLVLRDLGISGSLRLGIQRQVASRFSGTAVDPQRSVVCSAVAVNSAGVLTRRLLDQTVAAAFLLLAGVATAVYALRLLEPPQRPAKIKGVHASFPVFVRLAYVWAMVAAVSWNLGRFG